MMSAWRKRNSGARMWAMFASEPVSTLSTQMTRWPRASSSSQRCEPRKPAPPVTRQVAMTPNIAAGAEPLGRRDPMRRAGSGLGGRLDALRARGLQGLLGHDVDDDVAARRRPLGVAREAQALPDHRALLAPRARAAAALL